VIGCLQTIFTSIFFGNTLYIHGTIEIVKWIFNEGFSETDIWQGTKKINHIL
jgi:hypothetical protein